MNPFEHNLQRLLTESYRPEEPDPDFVAQLQQRLCNTAQQRAATQANEQRIAKIRRALGWTVTTAALVVAIVLVQQAKRNTPGSGRAPLIAIDPEIAEAGPWRLTPKEKAPPPQTPVLALGETLITGTGQRRRVQLPDGSVLFVNRDTRLTIESPRRVRLEQGEVYVEVAPRPDEHFVVQTPDRQVTALGTRFTVRANDQKTSVAVTQGKVKISGLDEVLYAGQQIAPDEAHPTPAPRLSQLIDWTRDLMAAADSPLVPANNYGGGRLIAFDSAGQEAKISLRKYHLDVHIEDGFARTTIDQTYFNHEQAQLEGTFYFPLPPDASISRLAMYVNGQLMEGGMAERDHARNTFEEIRYFRRDPALLEWLDGSTFKMRVFPLEGREEKRIVLSYTQRLPVQHGQTTYRFPAGHNSQVAGKWSTEIRVLNAAGLNWSCLTHSLQAAQDGQTLVLKAETRHAALDRDLTLELTEATEKITTRVGVAELDGSRYVMLRHRPKIEVPAKPQAAHPRHFVVLFESSADRDPLLARTQIEVLRTFLENLEHHDTFQVITAGTRAKRLSDQPLTATAENIAATMETLGRVHLVGALDLEAALEAAGPLLQGSGEPWLLHVGGGIASLGIRRDAELLKHLPEGVRYAGIGIGKRWGRAFMKHAAERTGGHYTQINPDEPVAWRAFEFLSSLRLPRWQNISIADDTGRTWLLTEATVAAGEELCAVTRFDVTEPLPKEVVIHGLVDGRAFEERLSIANINHNAGYIPRTWGKLEIDRLVAQDSTAHKAKIIELSKALYVMSPFTSLLVLETEQMYQQYKVDRGRKDHWAMYLCPAKIDVVRDGKTTPTPQTNRRPAADVLKSIMIRNARYAWATNETIGRPCTAWDQLTNATPGVSEAKQVFSFHVGSESSAMKTGRNSDVGESGQLTRPRPTTGVDSRLIDHLVREKQANLAQVITPTTDYWLDPNRRNVVAGRTPAGTFTHHLDLPLRTNSFNAAIQPFNLHRPMSPNAFGGGNGAVNFSTNFTTPIGGGLGGFGGGFGGFNGFGMGGQLGVGAGQLGFNGVGFGSSTVFPPNGGFGWNPGNLGINGVVMWDGNGRFRQFGWNQWNWQPGFIQIPQAMTPLTNSGLGATPTRLASPLLPDLMLYPTNMHSINWSMVVADLVAYAPGLETSAADIAAVLEREAKEYADIKLGRIDEGARKLIDGSRRTGWRTQSVAGGSVTFDGSGRFVLNRTLPTGLRETIVHDGDWLLHLYPEIALGARRPAGRAYRDEFAPLLPGALPPVEDLARGADVVVRDERTVAIVPLVQGEAKSELRLVFDDEGRLIARRFIGEGGKEVAAERFDKVKFVAAPNLKPDLGKLVMLPMPYRTADWCEARSKQNPPLPESLGTDETHLLLAAHFAAAPHDGTPVATLTQFVLNRMAKHHRQIGLLTLLRAAGNLNFGYGKHFDSSGNKTLENYLDYAAVTQPTVDNDTSSPFLLGRMNRLSKLWFTWHQNFSGTPQKREAAWRETRDFIKHNRDNSLGWFATILATTDRTFSQDDWKSAAELWQLFESDPIHGYEACYNRIQCLLRAGLPQTARMIFDDLYRDTLAAGRLPRLDSAVQSLPPNEDGLTWDALLVRTAGNLAAKGRGFEALALAEQCFQLGGAPLARRAFGVTAPHLERFPVPVQFAAAVFLARIGDQQQADKLLKLLMSDKELAGDPLTWRLAADLAAQSGSIARKVHCLERALELEFARMPEVFEVQSLRQDYQAMLIGYGDWLTACRAAEVDPPADLANRIIKAADRWRSLDPDETAACQLAARLLRQLQLPDATWEYLTTPLAGKANEAEPFLKLAQELQATNELPLAEKALAAAFAAEPTNAQLLMDRVHLLIQIGRMDDSRRLLEQLANGTWQPRFSNVQLQARSMLGR